jgi:hypothetical protein
MAASQVREAFASRCRFRKDISMQTRPFALPAVGALSLLFLAVAAADDAKPVAVELKSFKFQEAKADLFGYNEGEERLFFYTNGTAEAKIKVPAEGNYEIVVKAASDKAMNEGARFKVAVDGKQVGKETEAASDEPKEYKFATALNTALSITHWAKKGDAFTII